MLSEYEREHAITEDNPMGQQPRGRSILQELLQLADDGEDHPEEEQMTIWEALGLDPGNSKKALKSMKSMPKLEIGLQPDKDAQCAICFGLLNEKSPKEAEDNDHSTPPEWNNSQLTKMPCNHFYHTLCLAKWLKQTNTCPVCRETVQTDSEIERAERDANIEELHDSMFS